MTLHIPCSRCGAAVPVGEGDYPAVYPSRDGELDTSCEPECWAVCNETCGNSLIVAGPVVTKGEPDRFFFYVARKAS